MANMDQRRRASFTREELTPIVLDQLQTAKLRRAASNRTGDRHSGSDSDSRKWAAEAFMTGIQSALSAPAKRVESEQGLSKELVSEVDVVLSKLMSSVNQRDDPKLVPLINSLQASLRATVDQHQPQLGRTHSSTSSSDLSTPGSASKSGVNSSRNPFRRGHDQVALTEFPLDEEEPAVEEEGGNGGSKIPWKIRAARRRAAKPHTTGMTKEEFAEIKQSLKESAEKRENSSFS